MVSFQSVRERDYTREARGMLGPQQIQLDRVPTDTNERGKREGERAVRGPCVVFSCS